MNSAANFLDGHDKHPPPPPSDTNVVQTKIELTLTEEYLINT